MADPSGEIGDAQLVQEARAGDRAAFGAIYSRYADRIHDFCRSALRDPHEAADVTQETFLVAAGRLGQLREPDKLRAWLYAIARNEAMRRSRSRRRATPTPVAAEMASDRAGPEESAGRTDAREIVWAAAAGLSARDRVLLDLTVRQGLDGQELADAIGAPPANAYVMASRLRAQVERAISALLVARYGRRNCPELDAMLAGWDGRLDPLVRKRVARHIDGCEICTDRRLTLASPLALLGAVPLVPAPAELRDRVLGQVELVSHVGPRHGRPRNDGFPPPLDPRPYRRPPLIGAAAVVAVALVVLAALAIGSDDGTSVATAGTDTTIDDDTDDDEEDEDDGSDRPSRDRRNDDEGAEGSGGEGDDGELDAAPDGAVTGGDAHAGDVVAPPGVIPVPRDADGNPIPDTTGGAERPGTGRSGLPSGAGGGDSAPTDPAPTDPAPTDPGPTDPGPTDPGAPGAPGPASPADVVLDTTAVDLGADAVSAAVTISNEGGTAADWVAAPGAAWLGVTPGGGSLAPGASVAMTLTADRAAAPEGNGVAVGVPVSVAGTIVGTITVTADVARPPVITELETVDERLAVRDCGVDSTGVTADVVDESGFERVNDIDPVVLEVTGPGGDVVRVPMTFFGAATWTATLGPFATPGTATWIIIATDPHGNEARTPPQSIVVDPCPR